MVEKKEKNQEKFLKEAVTVIVGKQYEPIASLLNSDKHVNEFTIARKLDVTINQTRNLLYKIADYGLVSSIRKKDKKKGWYTYFWKMEILKSLEFLKGLILKKMEQINGQIKSREIKQFYHCPKCGTEYTEENALLYDFTCSECGSVFVLKDNSKAIKGFRRSYEKLEEELKIIDDEISVEKSKNDKKRVKEVAKAAKVKAKLNKIKREAAKKKIVKVKKRKVKVSKPKHKAKKKRR